LERVKPMQRNASGAAADQEAYRPELVADEEPRYLRRQKPVEIRRKKLGDSVEIFNMAVGSADGLLEFWHNEEHSADHRVVTEHVRAVSRRSTGVVSRCVDKRGLFQEQVGTGQFDIQLLITAGHFVKLFRTGELPKVNA